jgi:hypothetical protein
VCWLVKEQIGDRLNPIPKVELLPEFCTKRSANEHAGHESLLMKGLQQLNQKPFFTNIGKIPSVCNAQVPFNSELTGLNPTPVKSRVHKQRTF